MRCDTGTGERDGRPCCIFCRWSSLHTCTGYDCGEALEKARAYWKAKENEKEGRGVGEKVH